MLLLNVQICSIIIFCFTSILGQTLFRLLFIKDKIKGYINQKKRKVHFIFLRGIIKSN